jgi:biotin carboxylase
MLLGGARHQVPAIEAAKRLGLRTVLCDYLPDNPGQYVADVFYQESTTDRDKMFEIARREHIDGIISFGSDVSAPNAAFIAERLGLATNPLASVETLSSKNLFRPYLREHGFNCPKFASFAADATAAEVLGLVSGMAFPIVIKPTDSSGSKGVSVVESPDEKGVGAALTSAREFTRNGTLCAEEFIPYGYPHLIGGDVFVSGGEVRFWGLMDCLRDGALGGLVPAGKAYPTGLSDAQTAAVRGEISRLVKSLGLRFGEMNVEVILAPGDRPYVLELAARAGGNMIPVQLSDISGIDIVEASVREAMGDASTPVAFDGNGQCVATSVLHARTSGAFVGVRYDDAIKSHIYREMVYVRPGDHVECLSNGSQAIGLVFMSFDDPGQMRDLLSHVSEHVTVEVA